MSFQIGDIKIGGNNPPFIIAEMTQSLCLNGSERVLEIGTGSGYQAAVLSRIVYNLYKYHKFLRRETLNRTFTGLFINHNITFNFLQTYMSLTR